MLFWNMPTFQRIMLVEFHAVPDHGWKFAQNPFCQMCSATAEVSVLAYFTIILFSFRCVSRLLDVWPMYITRHIVQGILLVLHMAGNVKQLHAYEVRTQPLLLARAGNTWLCQWCTISKHEAKTIKLKTSGNASIVGQALAETQRL